MKRVLLASAVAAVFVLPGSAISSSTELSSEMSAKRGSFNIAFDVFTRNGKPKKVGFFEYDHAPVTCETGGPLEIDGTGFGIDESGPNGPAKVEDKKFSKTYAGTSGGGGETSQKFTGKFKNQNQKVEGTLRVKGDFPNNSATNCDSGKINYTAD